MDRPPTWSQSELARWLEGLDQQIEALRRALAAIPDHAAPLEEVRQARARLDSS